MANEDRKLVSVRFDDAVLYRDLRHIAADRDLSMSELIVAALDEWRATQPKFVKASPQAPSTKKEEPAAKLGSVTKSPPQKAPAKAGAKKKS